MSLVVGPTIFTKAAASPFPALADSVQKFTLGLNDLQSAFKGTGNFSLSVANSKYETVSISSTEVVGLTKAVSVAGAYEMNIGGNQSISTAGSVWQEIGNSLSLLVGRRFEIVCGEARFVMLETGEVEITGESITLNGQSLVKARASKIELN
jgi:type VI secretion system secreted protein VgrG